MEKETGSWLRVLVTVLGIPLLLLLLGSVLTSYFIPKLIEESHKSEASRTARLKKAIDIIERNKDFTSKLHVLKTSMQTFNKQNVRGKPSLTQLREAQKRFKKEYTDHYLALDETAWWWYWDLEREVQIFDLLSPEELAKLGEFNKEYGNNVGACVGALDPLWRYLSSSEYKPTKDSQDQVNALEAQMKSEIDRLFNERVILVKNISTLFAQSQHETP